VQNFLFTNAAHTGLVAKGMKIKTNGCTFESNFDWAANAGTSAFFLQFRDAEDVQIDEITFTNTVALATTINTAGVHLMTFTDACKGMDVGYVRMVGGAGCVFIDRSGGFSNQDRARGFRFGLLDLQDVYYGLNPQFNGDRIDAKLRTQNSGRSYFNINSSHHVVDVRMTDTRDVAQQINLAVGCEVGGENRISNIDLKVSGTHHGNVVNMQMAQASASAAAGRMNNVNIQFRLESAAGVTGGTLVNLSKSNVSGAFDSTVRGHVVTGIHVSGFLQNIDSDTTIATICTDGDWTGETVRNVGFHDMIVSGGGAIVADGRGLDSPASKLYFRHVDARFNNLTLTNIPQGSLEFSEGNYFLNMKSNAAFGSGKYEHLPGGRLRQYGRTTCTGGVTPVAVTLPVAMRGATAADNDIDGFNNYSGGTPGFSLTVPSTTTLSIARADTTGDKDCGWSVTGYSSATGSTE
jgi:hypothetical protein